MHSFVSISDVLLPVLTEKCNLLSCIIFGDVKI